MDTMIISPEEHIRWQQWLSQWGLHLYVRKLTITDNGVIVDVLVPYDIRRDDGKPLYDGEESSL